MGCSCIGGGIYQCWMITISTVTANDLSGAGLKYRNMAIPLV